VLAYADEDVFGVVLPFVQDRSGTGEERIQGMTRELADTAITTGGSFYLPCRLHASNEQLRRVSQLGNSDSCEEPRRPGTRLSERTLRNLRPDAARRRMPARPRLTPSHSVG